MRSTHRIGGLLALAGIALAAPLSWARAADDCSMVRLDASGGPMEHVRTLDQGMLNICYSYPACELIDAWRFSHGPQPPPGGYNHVTSPIVAAIGLQHFKGEKATFDKGAPTEEILQYLSTANSCSEMDVFQTQEPGWATKENAYISLMSNAWTELTRYFNDRARIRRIFDDLEARHAEPETIQYEVFYKQGAFPIADSLTCKLRQQLNIPADLIPTRNFHGSNLAIANYLLYADRVRYFYDYFQQACSRFSVPILPRPPSDNENYFNPDEGSKATRLIKARLNRNPAMPVIANLCGHMLTDPGYHGYTKNSDGTANCQNGGTHSVLVIGKRRKQDGTCQLLVRNSWGLDCFQYRRVHPVPPPPSDDPSTPPTPPPPDGYDCDHGTIWVNESDFLGNTYGVHYLND